MRGASLRGQVTPLHQMISLWCSNELLNICYCASSLSSSFPLENSVDPTLKAQEVLCSIQSTTK